MTRPIPDDLSMLASFYRRWEPQEDRRREISEDLKELFSEAKGNGFNGKAMRRAFAAQYRLDHEDSEQREARELTDDETELYLSALARVRESDAVHDGLAEPASGDDGRLANSKSALEHEPAHPTPSGVAADGGEGEPVALSANQSTAVRKNARIMVPCVCEVCGGRFEVVPHEAKRGRGITCSKSCAAKLASHPDQTGPNNPNWKGGVPASVKNDRYIAKHPHKHAAHLAMTAAIRRGELVRQPCEVCGDPKTDGHHDDYSKPLDVRWLCRPHHIAHHKAAGTQAPPVDTPKPVNDDFARIQVIGSINE